MKNRLLNARFIQSSVLGLFVVTGLTACADFGGVNSRGELSPQERRMQAMETKVADVSRRVEVMTHVVSSQAGSSLEDELRDLRGEVERLSFELQREKKSKQELFASLDARVTRLEQGGVAARAASGASNLAATATPEEQAAYVAAFDLLKAGKYDDAILGFENVTKNWPQGKYADSSYYWLGESRYLKKDYANAQKSFEKMLELNPASNRAPDALLKIGFAQFEQGKNAEGKATLQKLVQEYPDSGAAKLAKQRLG